MNRYILTLSLCGLLGFTGIGCGPSSPDEPTSQTDEQLPADDGQAAAPAPDGQVEAMAKNCRTTCTGHKNTGVACGVVGHGSTTFLGGCKKACRFAQQDADTKAQSSGCELEACNDEC